MFAKLSAKGEDIAPLYKYLTDRPEEEFGGEIPWNFTKFIVGRDGKIVGRFNHRILPEDEGLVAVLEKALAAPKTKTAQEGAGK